MGKAMVDNVDVIRERILKFDNMGDFYVVHILKRKKDGQSDFTKGDDDARLIKTYYIDSLEYFDRKIGQIKNLCFLNGARAYIMPQRRNRLVTNRAMLRKLVDEIDNAGIHYDHIVRSSVCGCHASDMKRWVIDCDIDGNGGKWLCMVEGAQGEKSKERMLDEYVEENVRVIKGLITAYGEGKYSADDVFVIPTKHGKHIITPPFASDPKILADTMIDSCNIKRDEMTLMYVPSESLECSETDCASKLHAVMDYLMQSNRTVYEDVLNHVKV